MSNIKLKALAEVINADNEMKSRKIGILEERIRNLEALDDARIMLIKAQNELISELKSKLDLMTQTSEELLISLARALK